MPAPDRTAPVQDPAPEGHRWHALEADQAVATLDADQGGLSTEEAARRLEKHGPNRLPEAEKEGPLKRLLRQFHDVLIYILLGAAVVTALLGEWIDTGVILAVVVINAVIGFIQEGKAEAALESIRAMLSLHAVALRDGERQEIEADELVPGDVVIVESGDRVPADLRILQARNLQVEEAVLTGESEPVTKTEDALAEDAVIGDRRNMLFSGTTITRGRATALVVETGTDTQIGRIGEMVSQVEQLTTPLLRAINRFGKVLSVIIVFAAAATFAFGYFVRDYGLEELFMIAVGLAVAAIPEGLPAIMTITLALGVQRMAKRRAILRRLPAVETLGSVTVICSDKTGTLTRNEMTVARIATADGLFSVTGVGYEPDGDIVRGDASITPADEPVIDQLLRTGVLASDATLRHRDDEWIVDGDPTEGALIVLAGKAGRKRREIDDADGRIDAIPFESENRYMATLTDGEHGRTIHVKGAPERIFDMCESQLTGDGAEPLDREHWEKHTLSLADEGHRVLALAIREVSDGTDSISEAGVQTDLTLVGIVGIIDPPRAEAIDAVGECRAAGIRVKMITGDHARTASAIATQLGIGEEREEAVTGAELEAMTDEELFDVAHRRDVFARTSPEHKLRLVEALQRRGEVVAMTGDGVNDAPALRRADVGVAMGIKGAEASKDASDMVLADDNFATIARAVREGRTIYDNLKKTILFILPTNGAEALMILAALMLPAAVLGFAVEAGEAPLPITPVQILWANMVTAVTLALALAFEPTEPGVMRRPPRDPNEPILSGYLVWRIGFVSVIIGVAALWLFRLELGLVREQLAGLMAAEDIEAVALSRARTMAVNVLVAGQFFYLFNSRFIRRSMFSLRSLVGNPYAIGAGVVLFLLQVTFTYVPAFQIAFGTDGLPLDRWLWVNAAGLAVFFLVEIEKALLRTLTPDPAKAVAEAAR